MQPLTAMPAGALIQMGSWNTHLAGGSLYYKGPALQKMIPDILGTSSYGGGRRFDFGWWAHNIFVFTLIKLMPAKYCLLVSE